MTALRLPRPDEKGRELVTYVKAAPAESDGSTVRVEARNIIGDEHIIARNPGFQGTLAGQTVFNEWLIDHATAQKNYGADVIAGLGPVFTYHRKIATIRLIELDRALLQELGVEGDEFALKGTRMSTTPPAGEGCILEAGKAHECGFPPA